MEAFKDIVNKMKEFENDTYIKFESLVTNDKFEKFIENVSTKSLVDHQVELLKMQLATKESL